MESPLNAMNNQSYIPLKECVRGGVYKLRSRNLDLGAYDGNEGFIGIRLKFNERYLFTEYHHDQGAPYGTVFPLEKVGQLPDNINLSDRRTHKDGDSWAMRGDDIVPAIRRDLQENEQPHGTRQGFVDLYADTLDRTSGWVFMTENKELFKFLDEFYAS